MKRQKIFLNEKTVDLLTTDLMNICDDVLKKMERASIKALFSEKSSIDNLKEYLNYFNRLSLRFDKAYKLREIVFSKTLPF